MGQYYTIVNIDKQEYLYTHRLGDGLKLLEFGSSGFGTMMALAVLLAKGYRPREGDLQVEGKIVGSWAGDRIVVSGDYADNGKFLPEKTLGDLLPPDTDTEVIQENGLDLDNIPNLYSYSKSGGCRDISLKVAAVLCGDPEIRKIWLNGGDFSLSETVKKIKKKYLPWLEIPEKKGKK